MRRPASTVVAPLTAILVVVLMGLLPAIASEGPPRSEVSEAPPDFPVRARDRNRAALEDRVVALAQELNALPVSLEDRTRQCDTSDIAITYERIPPGRFKLGAYIEPLVRPHPAQGTHALGIAFCRASSLAIMGFEALWSDSSGWEIWPIPAPEST